MDDRMLGRHHCSSPMTTDMSAPATKKDLALVEQRVQKEICFLKEDVSGLKQDVSGLKKDVSGLKVELSEFKREMRDFREETDGRFNRLEQRLYAFEIHVGEWKDELKLHFDAAVEIIRHDLRSANREEIENIKDRVTRLERREHGYLKAA